MYLYTDIQLIESHGEVWVVQKNRIKRKDYISSELGSSYETQYLIAILVLI